jgi:Tol biopolymer transport system component/tRNA A-37 threonylcarbamoyl transferase component Bud32
MGVVYVAVHPVLDRRAVVKVLRPKYSADPDLAKRFTNEAKAAAAITHPGIVDVIDVGRFDDDQLYILMEHLDGESLRARIKRKGRVDLDRALTIVRQAAGALEAAHRAGIVHRDLKPDNMFLVPDPEVSGGERVKLLDFGIAKLTPKLSVANYSTHTGAVMGTPLYMSPEQCGDSAAVDERTDLYALGCILYELLSGQPPFVHTSAGEIIAAHIRDTAAPPSAIAESISPDADELVCAMLAKDPGSRPASAAEVIERIDAIRGTRPARPLDSVAGNTRTLPASGDVATDDTIAPPSSQIDDAPSTLGEAAAQAVSSEQTQWYTRRWAGWALGAVALGAIAVVVVPRLMNNDEPAADSEPVAVGEQAQLDASAPTETTPAVTRLTRSDGVFLYPSLSRDGQRIAYTDMTDILVRRVQGTRATNLTEDIDAAAIEPAFSPDGEEIAFSSDGDIYVMGASGENKRRVAEGGYWPTWSPDGAMIAYTTQDTYDIMVQPGSGGELWRVDVGSGARSKLVDAEENPRQPDWSPDGKRIVFFGNRGITTVRADGSGLAEAGLAYAWQPVWDEDSRGVYAVRDRGGQYEIIWHSIDSETGEGTGEPRVALPLGRTTLWHFTVANRGTRWIGSVYQTAYVVFRIELDPATGKATSLPAPITDKAKYLKSPALSPDGDRLAFASYQMKEDMYVSLADGSELERITARSEYRRAPDWSPDGKRIAFHGTVANEWGIWAMNPDGAQVKKLSPDRDLSYRRPQFSPTGSRLAVTAHFDDGPQPMIIDLSKPWSEQIDAQANDALRGWSTGPWSPNGEWIALYSTDGVARLGVNDRRLVSVSGGGTDAAWRTDSEMFVGDGNKVLLFGLATGASREVIDLSPWRVTVHPSLDMSPDRTKLYVGARLEEASLYLTDLVENAPQPR